MPRLQENKCLHYGMSAIYHGKTAEDFHILPLFGFYLM
jgi:hypothetical protein